MINYNENKGGNDRLHRYDIMELDKDMVTNILTMKCVPLC